MLENSVENAESNEMQILIWLKFASDQVGIRSNGYELIDRKCERMSESEPYKLFIEIISSSIPFWVAVEWKWEVALGWKWIY